MAEKHELEPDGILSDGVRHHPADESALDAYARDREELASFKVPVLRHANDPHEYLFVAALDGTGNDGIHDPQHQTNVAKIAHQIQASNDAGETHIAAGYVAGAGTQNNLLKRTLDGMDGYTAEERAETMYKAFIEQAYAWRKADPQARISLADIGFSRGADEVAIFARLVHERGIQDPRGAVYTYTSDGLVKHAEYSLPPLVSPGQVAQAVALFDAVGTGNEVRNDDRRLPSTVISGLQLFAMDETRSLFKSDHIIDPGISADGRFAGVYVPGAHSDVGGGYHRDGLSTRAGNMVIDYLNRLNDKPFLQTSIEPEDPRLNVVHRSEEGMFIYRITGKVNRLEPEGYNELLVPRRDMGKVPDPYNAEPVDEAIRARYEVHSLYETATPVESTGSRNAAEHALSLQVDHMLAAAQSGDWGTFMRDNQQLAAMDAGRDLRAQSGAAVDALEQSALHQPVPQAAVPLMETRGPMR
ncbi:MAG: phospholipase effector Tle1 domain-containing protein [Dyella sp.]|uniref:phospholipase effector Tle1 domain-containing protein n=1 Tax=Dyella sp. TaxID=1869338 RepID=UPI003F7FF688